MKNKINRLKITTDILIHEKDFEKNGLKTLLNEIENKIVCLVESDFDTKVIGSKGEIIKYRD